MTEAITFRIFLALIISVVLSLHGLRRKSLNVHGAQAAFFVGLSSFVASYRFGITLILFYISGSCLTKFGSKEKRACDINFEKESARGPMQVLCCSIIGCIIGLAYFIIFGNDIALNFSDSPNASWFLAAYLGHYACCCGDTFASEVGVLTSYWGETMTKPRLILGCRVVPRGTNGAVSLVGTIASIIGGAFIGIVYAFCGHCFVGGDAMQLCSLTVIGAICGLFGSAVDSILGQLFQVSYFSKEKKCVFSSPGPNCDLICGTDFLSNTQVNLISAGMTSIFGGYFAQWVNP